jgi:hypothetical protein
MSDRKLINHIRPVPETEKRLMVFGDPGDLFVVQLNHRSELTVGYEDDSGNYYSRAHQTHKTEGVVEKEITKQAC